MRPETVSIFLPQTDLGPLEDPDFEFFREAIHSVAGLTFNATKRELMKTRLTGRVRELKLSKLTDYRRYLEGLGRSHSEWQEFVNALTTNKTDFFREPKHFDYLTNTFLPQWLKSGEKTLKIWSAASSTGEEAYTLAMILDRALPKGRDFKILATDIDTQVLSTGANGVYRRSRLSEVPEEYQDSFIIGTGEIQDWMKIRPHLRDKVTFKTHNLVDETFVGDAVFDLVFCRNVLIYFAPPEIEFVARKLWRSAKEGGFLFIGHSESLQSIDHAWKGIGPSVFVRGSK